jgi:glutathione S-transferase
VSIVFTLDLTNTEGTQLTIELYSISGAPRPWRALLGLVAKGLDFELRTLNGSKKEHKEPAFLALNPRGRVPVLKKGDFVLPDSMAILAYLEKEYPDPPIFGTTPEEHARIWQLVSEGEDDLRETCDALLSPLFFLGQDETSPDVQKAALSVHQELKLLEVLLERSPFLAGSRVTAADCVCFPDARLVIRATERFPETMRRLELHPFAELYPRTTRWVDRIEALPGYEKTFPAHWRAT